MNVFLHILIILQSTLASPFLHVGAQRGRKRPKPRTEGSVCQSSPRMPKGELSMQTEVCVDSGNVSVSANPTALCAGVKPPSLLEIKRSCWELGEPGGRCSPNPGKGSGEQVGASFGGGSQLFPSPPHACHDPLCPTNTPSLSVSAVWCYLSVKISNKAQQHHSNPTRCALTRRPFPVPDAHGEKWSVQPPRAG